MDKTRIYCGKLEELDKEEVYQTYEEGTALYIDKFNLLDDIENCMRAYGNFLSVQFYVLRNKTSLHIDSPEKVWEALDAEYVKFLSGVCTECEYYDQYSEYTGYLWTDSNFTVGGHDLAGVLKQYLNRHIVLKIKFSEDNKGEYNGTERA